MEAPQATIVVVARERFSLARRSLETIYENTKSPFKLVYVDGGSPNSIKGYLETKALENGFQLIRKNHYLSPNQARNLGLRQVKSQYVVFIENDVLVSAGWLEALVRCSEETAAWVVGPLYLMGEPEHQIIHMAGGLSHIKEEKGIRILYEEDYFSGIRVSDLPVRLQRKKCELVEFHCMLVRTELFERIGPLDEGLLSVREHDDLCLAVQKLGGSIYLEPNAVVTYVYPPPLSLSDFRYFTLRWSEKWLKASLQHFHQKWNLDMDENHPHYGYLWKRRHLFFRQFTKPLKTLRQILSL